MVDFSKEIKYIEDMTQWNLSHLIEPLIEKAYEQGLKDGENQSTKMKEIENSWEQSYKDFGLNVVK